MSVLNETCTHTSVSGIISSMKFAVSSCRMTVLRDVKSSQLVSVKAWFCCSRVISHLTSSVAELCCNADIHLVRLESTKWMLWICWLDQDSWSIWVLFNSCRPSWTYCTSCNIHSKSITLHSYTRMTLYISDMSQICYLFKEKTTTVVFLRTVCCLPFILWPESKENHALKSFFTLEICT